MEQIIVQHLTETICPHTIILFGSMAKGNLHKESDVDIAFLSHQAPTEYEIFMVAQALADKLGTEVDLVDLNRASTVFQAQIIGKGKILLDREPSRRMTFFMRALKEYAMLNEERKPIFDRMVERGSLYRE
ncbi:nucleotidyltransferase domain-containing protein [Aneurinibacillus sp. Ricciae_BoGa-3]|uniref:type VII toxin-antitoxin system MntA family adenylyltransferase antitoxin n=1 Tax=Aneurinibacillus sp. Ricciae_BoGa-3 TaxID=3022697 RepID=UPI00233FEA18|nr:nucleotidyltransferase domain-containing protein [Aneurinibacillus sp. Ricciae_BoGa-3]WCK52711.1 nucleotidyltransferase domain-containing protein [Aneurinibacillus sp. Ricciae_BoGa-3]